MKTLAITLCLLLVVIPAGAQQIAKPPSPNFYVPYAVSLTAPADEVGESSSRALLAESAATPAPPQRRQYPVRPRYPRQRHASNSHAVQPLVACGVLVSAIAALGLIAFVVGGDR